MAKRSFLDRLGLHRPELRAWALYDVANSAWMTTVMQVFQIYIVIVGVAGGLSEAQARARYMFASSLAIILVGLTGPLLGAIADYRGSKKSFLAAFLAVGAVTTGAMFFIGDGQWVYALTTFVVGNVCVTATLAFYNALLPAIAGPYEVDRVSTAGFALGYLGGGLLLAANGVMMAHPDWFGLPGRDVAIRLSFVSVAVWWVVFSIPLFRKVPEPPRRLEADEKAGQNPVVIASRRLAETFQELRTYKDAGLLLLAFLVYNDAVNTIIRAALTFGGEVGIEAADMIGALILVQFVGVPFAFGFGLLADRIGAKRAIYLALAVYTVISLLGFFLKNATQFYVMAALVGTVQGGAQALGRSLFATMIPKHKAGEMFGFFGVFDRFGGSMGTFLFGVLLAATGSSRPAILILIVFFALGAFILSKVDVERGRRQARAAEAASTAPESHASA
ncbi:MAG: MFS transporter [Acidobacteria bacterium]|jgi:UMF1 family MFS transporter|nr:MFS transporter [Acidobacteriota bacterium]